MRTGLLFFLILNSTANALEYGHCEALPNSKNYISSDFSAYYPKNVTFSCKYRCADKDSIKIIQGNSTVHIASVSDDAKKMVCQGVRVIESKWGYEYDGAIPFYAYETMIKSINKWAFENIERNDQIEQKLLTEFKEQLNTIASSYAIAGSSASAHSDEFFKAAGTLASIAAELPQNSQLLDQQVEKLVLKQGKTSKSITSDSLVLNIIKTLSAWRNPHYLYTE